MNTIQCESEFWIRVPYMPDISLFNWINNIVFSSEFVFSHFTPCSFWYVTKTATFAAAGLATVWNAIRSSFTLPWGHYKNNVWTPETWHNRNWIDMQFRLGGHSNALFFPLHNSSMTHIYIYKCAIGCDCVVHAVHAGCKDAAGRVPKPKTVYQFIFLSRIFHLCTQQKS